MTKQEYIERLCRMSLASLVIEWKITSEEWQEANMVLRACAAEERLVMICKLGVYFYGARAWDAAKFDALGPIAKPFVEQAVRR